MAEAPADDTRLDFVRELKDYIPALRGILSQLDTRESSISEVEITELHRLVHTIRGASSLVKLNHLSAVALAFENVVEEIMHHRLMMDQTVFRAMSAAVDFFNDFSGQHSFDDVHDSEMQDSIIETLDGCRGSAKKAENGLPEELVEIEDKNDVDHGLDLFDLEADQIAWEDDLADPADGDAVSMADTEAVEFDRQHAQSETKVDTSSDWEDIDLPQQELLEGFYLEAEDHFLELTKALGTLEAQIKAPVALTPQHKELLGLIRRSVHTIKGAAAVINLKPIAGWGHEFEDVLDWLHDEADFVSPDVLAIISDAADMLERFVSAPQEVDPLQVERLRAAFREMIGPGPVVDGDPENDGRNNLPDTAFRFDAIPSEAGNDPPGTDGIMDAAKEWSLLAAPSKTLRVDLDKIESLVNLGGELTIALSAFDHGMEDLGKLIGEIDRARVRLKNTARDLELGYEVKAIQQSGSPQSIFNVSSTSGAEKPTLFSDFDLLELDRYSELHLIIRSLSETAVDVSTISRQLSDIYNHFDAFLTRLRVLLSESHQKSMRMRMAPMSTIVHRMRRTVRETAVQLDKRVQLIIHGEHIELDKQVWEKLADPLMHLLRNAVDHGIEPATDRLAAGKQEIGTIDISAAYQGNQVMISVRDDGAGLDYAAIRQAAALYRPEENADAMGEEELAEMLFQPGFSTRHSVSQVSGRGVGLDVVKENIRELKGRVGIDPSAKGAGTTFRISLPLTMAVMQALLFDVAGQRYATALHDIKEIMRVNSEDIQGKALEKMVSVGDRHMPFYELSEFLPETTPESTVDTGPKRPLVIIMTVQGRQSAVAIDHMIGQKEIVVKNLGTHLGRVKGIAGATVLGDGKLIPILNLDELLDVETVRRHQQPLTSPGDQQHFNILVVDDSVSVRTVVARLMQRQGWRVNTAKDGVEAVEALHRRLPNLIILDVEMPRMNGYEFMSSVRSQPAFRHIPVIMLTSRAAGKHREKAETLGVNGYVTKPFIDEEFVALVKQVSHQCDQIGGRQQ